MRDIPNFGLVSNVPLDTMHLVFLGVVKKLLNLWHCGPLNVRLSTNLINQISKKSVDLSLLHRPSSKGNPDLLSTGDSGMLRS